MNSDPFVTLSPFAEFTPSASSGQALSPSASLRVNSAKGLSKDRFSAIPGAAKILRYAQNDFFSSLLGRLKDGDIPVAPSAQ